MFHFLNILGSLPVLLDLSIYMYVLKREKEEKKKQAF